jgi:hypothetical protein
VDTITRKKLLGAVDSLAGMWNGLSYDFPLGGLNGNDQAALEAATIKIDDARQSLAGILHRNPLQIRRGKVVG